jgi:ATP-dependent DNA helicase RecG
MRIFKDMELVEQLGSGIPRILQFYGRECFKFSDNFIRMSFPVEETTENVTEYVTENVTENVTEKRRLQVVEFMHKNPSITTEQLAKMLKVSKRTIIRDIEKLKNNNQIEYIGPAKGGHWKIIKK